MEGNKAQLKKGRGRGEKKKKDTLRTPSQAGCASSPLALATLWLAGYPRRAYLLLKARDMDDGVEEEEKERELIER